MTLLRQKVKYVLNGVRVRTIERFYTPSVSELEETSSNEDLSRLPVLFHSSETPNSERGKVYYTASSPLFIGSMDEPTARRLFHNEV